MQTTIILKELSALSSEAVQVKHATAPELIESAPPPPNTRAEGREDFRTRQPLRHYAPLGSGVPYRHWGINE